MHGKRVTLRSAKWRETKQEQHQSLGLAHCTAEGNSMASQRDGMADMAAQR
jgi:hypothetical protein